MTDIPPLRGVGHEQYNTFQSPEAQRLRVGNTPLSDFHERTLGVDSKLFRDKRVLDVGCGGGWLLETAIKYGASRAAGVEPSQLIDTAEERLKGLGVYLERTTFEEFQIDGEFDLITFIMSTEHMPNLPSILQKARQLMTVQGKILIITADMASFSMPRFDYKVGREVLIAEKEAKVTTERPNGYGETTDLVRTIPYWKESAEMAGLTVQKQRPVFADEQLIAAEGWKQFELFADRGKGSIPLFQYLELRRQESVILST